MNTRHVIVHVDDYGNPITPHDVNHLRLEWVRWALDNNDISVLRDLDAFQSDRAMFILFCGGEEAALLPWWHDDNFHALSP
jgi:hypothetical protein